MGLETKAVFWQKPAIMAWSRSILRTLLVVLPPTALASCVGLSEGWKDFADCSKGGCNTADASADSSSALEASSPQRDGDAESTATLTADAGTVTPPDAGTVTPPEEVSPTQSEITFDLPPVDHQNTLALGREFSCGIRNRAVGCWGDNTAARLGSPQSWPDGSETPVALDFSEAGPVANGFLPIEIVAGIGNGCIRSTVGTVLCWGEGAAAGQDANFTLPKRVFFTKEPTVGEPLELASGMDHSCAKWRSRGEVWCWGKNDHNQLGQSEPSTAGSLTPVQVDLAWEENGAVQITAGWWYACALRRDHSVWCWGTNDQNQLGRSKTDLAKPIAPVAFPPEADRIVEISAGEQHACARDRQGKVFCWGNNEYGQLTPAPGAAKTWPTPLAIPLPLPAVDLRAGGRHTCSRTTNGAVWCWGDNSQNQLGSPVASPSGPVRVNFAGDPKIKELAVGEMHSCVRREDDGVHCWGGGELERGGSSLTRMMMLP